MIYPIYIYFDYIHIHFIFHLVFQIASIGGPRIKQVVGFHFTSSTIETKAVAEMIEDIICKCDNAGINIPNVTADAGRVNKGAFK